MSFQSAFLDNGTINLSGGLVEWVAAGRPLVGDTDEPLVV